MKNAHVKISFLICKIALVMTACTTSQVYGNPTPSPSFVTTPSKSFTPTIKPTSSPTVTLTPTIYSAPQDEILDETCRITIALFYRYKQGDDPEAFRDLFVPSSQYLADSYPVLTEVRLVLRVVPASQWWPEKHAGTPVPGALLPERPNEYTYIVESTTQHVDDAGTLTYSYPPSSQTMILVADGPYSCKIKGFGHG